jgi:hypothetical protein
MLGIAGYILLIFLPSNDLLRNIMLPAFICIILVALLWFIRKIRTTND